MFIAVSLCFSFFIALVAYAFAPYGPMPPWLSSILEGLGNAAFCATLTTLLVWHARYKTIDVEPFDQKLYSCADEHTKWSVTQNAKLLADKIIELATVGFIVGGIGFYFGYKDNPWFLLGFVAFLSFLSVQNIIAYKKREKTPERLQNPVGVFCVVGGLLVAILLIVLQVPFLGLAYLGYNLLCVIFYLQLE